MSKSIEWFDPQRNFMFLPIVWGVFGTIILIAIIPAVLIICNSDPSLKFQLDGEGFNNFVSIFRVPLGIVALLIPILAILAASHKSEQSKAQITATHAQNRVSNYFKHREEFAKSVQGTALQNHPNRYHRLFYGNVRTFETTPKVKSFDTDVAKTAAKLGKLYDVLCNTSDELALYETFGEVLFCLHRFIDDYLPDQEMRGEYFVYKNIKFETDYEVWAPARVFTKAVRQIYGPILSFEGTVPTVLNDYSFVIFHQKFFNLERLGFDTKENKKLLVSPPLENYIRDWVSFEKVEHADYILTSY